MTGVRSDLEGSNGHPGAAAQVSAEAGTTGAVGQRSGLADAPHDKHGGRTWGLRRRWWVAAAWTVAPVALFFCYLRVSQTEPGDSYGAVFTLQAWDMLHGNLLLHGWWLSCWRPGIRGAKRPRSECSSRPGSCFPRSLATASSCCSSRRIT